MIWIFYVLLNVIGAGTAIFFTKQILKKSRLDYTGVMFVSLSFAVITYTPFFLNSLRSNPTIFTNPMGLFYFIIALAITVTGFYLYVAALSLGDLSVLGPLDNTRPFFVVLFSFLILGIKPTSYLLWGILFIVAGALLLHFRRQFFATIESLRHSKETLLILASTIVFGLGSIFDKLTLGFTQAIQYSYLILFGLAVAFGIHYLAKHHSLPLKAFFHWKMLGAGMGWTVGYLGIMTATKLASPNVVIPVQMTRSLYLSVLGFLFLKEKGYTKKLIAAALMLIGVFFITR